MHILHHRDSGCVQLVHNPLGGDTDGAHEQRRAALDDDVNELWKLSLGVIFLLKD